MKNLRKFQSQKAEATKKARAILDLAATEGRDLTAEENTSYEALKSTITGLNASIAREQELMAEEAAAGLVVNEDARISGGDHAAAKDTKRGFKSLGEFARAVKNATNAGSALDQRLLIGAAAPGTYSNEGAGADGGFAIPPAFSNEIWRLSLGEGSMIPLTDNTEVTGNSMVFPKDETTPWGGSGVQAYWRNEGPALTGSKLALGTSMLRLHELTVLAPVTNELLDDAPALGSYLQPLASERIMWKTNEAILFGTGVGQPKGVLAAANAALIVQAKDTSQATATISNANISNMVSRLKAGELMNAVWLGNPDILPALEGMSVGNYPIYLPNNNVNGASYGMLKGRPLLMSEHANGLGSQSDLSLVSLKGYRTITKAGGVETATSMHIYFDANATAFRFIFRIDGQPIISQPIQPPSGKGSKTRSYFVTLAARP